MTEEATLVSWVLRTLSIAPQGLASGKGNVTEQSPLAQENMLLHVAAKHGHVDVVWLLISRADTMLHVAKQGHATVVHILLARLESPEPLIDGSGRTALSHASEWGHHAVMTFLLASNKVHPNEESDISQLPLFQAVKVPRTSYKAIQLQVY